MSILSRIYKVYVRMNEGVDAFRGDETIAAAVYIKNPKIKDESDLIDAIIAEVNADKNTSSTYKRNLINGEDFLPDNISIYNSWQRSNASVSDVKRKLDEYYAKIRK